jgi:hypothetical protein
MIISLSSPCAEARQGLVNQAIGQSRIARQALRQSRIAWQYPMVLVAEQDSGCDAGFYPVAISLHEFKLFRQS